MVAAIIGTGIAARTAAETLLEGLGPEDRLIVVGDEKDVFYSRVFLPDYIAGDMRRDELFLAVDGLRGDERVKLVHAAVIAVDTERKELRLSDGRSLAWDRLIIAAGASARRLPAAGAGAEGVHVLRNIEDADAIRAEAARIESAAVVGGGLIGLKAAWALERLGKKVTVIVESDHLLSRVADRIVSRMLVESFQSRGTRFRFRTAVKDIRTTAGRVRSLALSDGSTFATDLVVIAKGVQPNLGFLRGSGIYTGRGVAVDSRMETSCSGVYAAGDVVELRDSPGMLALWPHAAAQGRIAARSLLGQTRRYVHPIAMNAVVFHDRPYVFLGDASSQESEGCRVYSSYVDSGKLYRKILVRENAIAGAILAGSIDFAGMICWDIRSGRRIDEPQSYVTREGLAGMFLSRNLCLRKGA